MDLSGPGAPPARGRFALAPGEVPVDDPLPRRRLLSDPGIGGRIKERPEDFLVDEIPLYQPSGEGEHVYLLVQKRSMPHLELVDTLARHYKVREEAIGFAGMKDKAAITRQMVSIHLPGAATPRPPEPSERLQVLWEARHGNKLRRGHLVGNRFAIRIRGIEPTIAPRVLRSLRSLEASGIPDYYGSQRFGYRRNTHRLGRFTVNGDHASLLSELVGTRSPFPEHQREARERFEAGAYAESIPFWSRNDRAERAALRELAAGRTPAAAVRAIHPTMRQFWVSAFQSAIFNRTLDRRLDDGLLAMLEIGDVAYKHQGHGQFLVTPEIAAAEDLSVRVSGFEISPSGPMLGKGMIQATGAVAERERDAAAEIAPDAPLLLAEGSAVEGTRRPFRVRVTNVEIDAGLDEHGNYLRLAFDLPRGAYATVLLRELMGDTDAVGEEGE